MIEIEKIIRDSITGAVGDLNLPSIDFIVEHPAELAHGDYASNVALVLGKEMKKNPMELAEQIAGVLKIKVAPLGSLKVRPWMQSWLERVEVVAPGFINFYLSPSFFIEQIGGGLKQGANYGIGNARQGEKILIEYTDPNPFKEFHIGHLMSNTIGEAIARLIAAQGAEVKRACYQGDVGMHVAKAIWGNEKLKAKNVKQWGEAYAFGAQVYETDEGAKKEINELNKKIYNRSDEAVNKIYDTGKKVSLDYFETIYKRLGTKFDYYFFESESGPIGQKLVEENIGKVFESSDGAVIFVGEKYDLHTRVFLTKEKLPTYEAKELGVTKLKFEKYLYDQSIVITGNEVASYFAVLKKVLGLILPDLAGKLQHLSSGMLRLPTGKMSSRTGNVITAESLIEEVKLAIKDKIATRDFDDEAKEQITEAVAVGAIKYSILKASPGRDVIFDTNKSISFEGDSGPYLQYAFVRALAVLKKGEEVKISPNLTPAPTEINELARRLTRFPSVVARSATLYAPNLLVTYLTELASTFNAYYAGQKIVDPTDPTSPHHLALTTLFAQTMKSGLTLLGLPTVERM